MGGCGAASYTVVIYVTQLLSLGLSFVLGETVLGPPWSMSVLGSGQTRAYAICMDVFVYPRVSPTQ